VVFGRACGQTRLMKSSNLFELVLLGAVWGASFLFMRMAAPAFGPIALIAVRVGVAALVLLPIALALGARRELQAHARALIWLGLVNSALPFVLFAYSTLSLNAGLASVLNATAPMWTAFIAWAAWGERLAAQRVAGLALGFVGVLWLAWDRMGAGDPGAAGLAVTAALLATACYGYAANYTRHRLSGVAPLSVAAGSQLGASLVLAPWALWTWPAADISARDWGAALALALVCTALAYLLYFRLIRRAGAIAAVSVTFIIPLAGVAWGVVFLGEQVGPGMLAGGVVILAGTALSLGLVRWSGRSSA